MYKKIKERNVDINYSSKFFDFKMGSIGALIMGGIVYYANSEYGFDSASIAASKQAAYTFLAGGSMTKMCENLAQYFQNGTIARIASSVVPSVSTISLTYLVHSIKGTPEPLESIVPTVLLAPPAFTYWGHKKRKELEALVD
ncbi:hypothetical protein KAT36_03670 [Candidatus Pacearchaeota archaeon]|nr:hypothetical protein [Candidatus Pacearchaeota archaeon]